MSTKQIMKALGATLALSAVVVAFSTESQALTRNADLSVTANVVGDCTLAATGPVAFGAVTAGANIDNQGALTVNCTSTLAYTLTLGAGGYAGQCAGANRCMRNTDPLSATFMPYDLYLDNGRASLWNTTAAGTYAGVGSGADQVLPVYGRIPSLAALPGVGGYADTVQATLIY